MPLYEFRCAEHGGFDVRLREPAPEQPCPVCEQAAPRVWGALPVIWRPWGYRLPPGDPGYWKIADRKDRLTCHR